MDLIIPQNVDCDYKINNTTLPNNQLEEFVLLDNHSVTYTDEIKNSYNLKVINLKSKESTKKSILNNTDYEKMLYFVCNLCPYLCIKDSKITEHLEKAHKSNKSSSNPLQLKCPACPNIFYRNMSLKSHLIHDHKVANTDLRQIVQAVIYYAKKSVIDITKSNEKKNDVPNSQESNCKNEIDMMLIEKLMNNDKLINHEHSYSKDPEIDNGTVCENTMGQVHIVKDLQTKDVEVVREVEVKHLPTITPSTLPIIDISHSISENTFNTLYNEKKPDTFSKFLDQKKMQRCKMFQCKVRMIDSEKLEYHLKCHTGNTFTCPECNETYGFWKTLSAHLWRLHKIDMELYACDKCAYRSTSLGKLNNCHKLIHSDVRAFSCDICKKMFKNTKQLRNHKVIHKDKVKKLIHACDICTKVFSDKRQLKVHMDVVHKKIKPFLCTYCGYKGATKSTLRMHIRQHTGEKPFSCDSCEYTTADHNSLRRHKLRHTGQKPYKCAHCNYACIQTSTYKEHIRTKHPGVEKDFVFTCQECQFRSVNQEMYASHLFLIHQQKPT